MSENSNQSKDWLGETNSSSSSWWCHSAATRMRGSVTAVEVRIQRWKIKSPEYSIKAVVPNYFCTLWSWFRVQFITFTSQPGPSSVLQFLIGGSTSRRHWANRFESECARIALASTPRRATKFVSRVLRITPDLYLDGFILRPRSLNAYFNLARRWLGNAKSVVWRVSSQKITLYASVWKKNILITQKMSSNAVRNAENPYQNKKIRHYFKERKFRYE